ncbi:MAG: DUF460 domain-containing protein [Candidatus Aenigmarchaeota archaeon]|nr:DUF460 domain-containing protein [Candidatus Aenigmarchaeota archaeon]
MKLIAGVDPGTRTGVAVLDISSGFYKTFMVKGSADDVCAALIEHGEPIIIASDKAKLPDFVRRVASSFNARSFYPSKDARISEKSLVTEGMEFSNDHEMDALAAALLAKKEYSRMFEKVDAALKAKEMDDMSDEVKELLLKNEAANIEQALKMLSKEEKGGVVYVPRWIESKSVYNLKKKLHEMERLVERQKAVIKRLEEPKVVRIERPVNTAKRVRILEAENRKLRKAAESADEQAILEKDFEIVHAPPDPEGNVFLVRSQKEARLAEKKGPSMLIAEGFEPDSIVPFIDAGKIRMERKGSLTMVRKDDLRNAFNEGFMNYMRLYKKRFDTK